ncbi:hypothetical protein TGDOM2_366710 [Toxoplasma gondii GAB2-2007-GAL-DOM2]|uniref:Uncharacterized protein n=1 Tax=Toxoplasma gondii GAB2-2007-GAL-DOM2 TaxID=1130820 RepID=A0A086JFQ4_TOXGO|nr:hypothetical protein TGDOM2_366710 [Toxoplasma gondii GAB2-2007-GAL-DOM2]
MFAVRLRQTVICVRTPRDPERTVDELRQALNEPHEVLPDTEDAVMKDGVRAVKTSGTTGNGYRPLTDAADFDEFHYSVTSGHTLVRKNELSRKAKYISNELFGDFVVSTDVRELGEKPFALAKKKKRHACWKC